MTSTVCNNTASSDCLLALSKTPLCAASATGTGRVGGDNTCKCLFLQQAHCIIPNNCLTPDRQVACERTAQQFGCIAADVCQGVNTYTPAQRVALK